MKSRVQKWGNSLALRIPKSFPMEAGVALTAMASCPLLTERSSCSQSSQNRQPWMSC